MDTHFSYLNVQFKSYIEGDNDILIEDDIVKAMKFNGGIAGTTVVLVDATSLGNKKAINKKLNVFKTGSRSTHEICWLDDRVQVIESSGISIDPLYTEGANSQIKVKIISFRFLSYFLLDF